MFITRQLMLSIKYSIGFSLDTLLHLFLKHYLALSFFLDITLNSVEVVNIFNRVPVRRLRIYIV